MVESKRNIVKSLRRHMVIFYKIRDNAILYGTKNAGLTGVSYVI